MTRAQPSWSGIAAPDNEVTSEREQGLSLLPATLPDLQEALGDQVAIDFRDWGLRVKRVRWDNHAAIYVKASR